MNYLYWTITSIAILGCQSTSPKEAPQFARWMVAVEPHHGVRGGTTQGTPVKLRKTPTKEWQALMKASSKKEKDRAAILNMSGPYRASFEFMETLGFPIDYKLDKTYRSWGTEYIYVVKNTENFVSLQHLMVMYFVKEGKTIGPMVMKHWRQDWTYQPKSYVAYTGLSQFRKKLTRNSQGMWLQAVYQVDDSPRDASVGRWTHHSSMSEWNSGETWRPLPRREFSVRSDYQTLIGYNRHIVKPNGWVHTQDNLKAVLNPKGGGVSKLLARETGLIRYQRIEDFDFSKGDEYWKKTGPFWADVRDYWVKAFQKQSSLTVLSKAGKTKMYQPLFEYAWKISSGEIKYNRQASVRFIAQTLRQFVKPAGTQHSGQY